MNELIKKINSTFDYQIRKNGNYTVDKLLFNESLKLTLSDWRNIRDENYWKEVDSIESDFKKKAYLLKCIYKYKNENGN